MNNERRYVNRSPQLLLAALACLLAGANGTVADRHDDLIAYWGFDEESGGTAHDYSYSGACVSWQIRGKTSVETVQNAVRRQSRTSA